MEKSKVEKHIDVVNSVTRLEEIIKAHVIPDEMVGDCVLIDAKKILDYIQTMKDKVTANFSVELNRKSNSGIFAPLRTAVNTMNNGREEGNTDESETKDGSREANLGETRKHTPFGGIKIDSD